MRRAALTLLAVLTVSGQLAANAPGELRPFVPGSLAGIEARRDGQPFLLVLWSVTCGPCREEFEMLAALDAERGPLPLVLVSTDDYADRTVAREMLERFGVAGAENWIFADADAQRLRYEIDPAWYGEMPRSYFYDAAHVRQGVSGGLKRERVAAWLDEVLAAR